MKRTFLMNRTGLTETFDDVLEVAKLIFEYCKAEAENAKTRSRANESRYRAQKVHLRVR